jgi:hypothetical protein
VPATTRGRPHDLVAAAEGLNGAIGHHQQLVRLGDEPAFVRHHHDGRAGRLEACDRLGQRLIAGRVEVGVGLIENDDRRITVERPRERNALAHAPRQRLAGRPHRRLVATREPQDGVVHAGCARRRNDFAGFDRAMTGDVLRDRAFEQDDILRDIADMAAQQIRSPLRKGCPVDPHGARRHRPDAGEDPNEAGLARPAGPDDGQRLTRLDREADVLQEQMAGPRRGRIGGFHVQAAGRPRQFQRLGLGGAGREDLGEFRERFACRNETPPGRYRLLDRRQCAADHQRRREDDTGLHGPVDHETGGDAHDGDLDARANEFRDAEQNAADGGAHGVPVERRLVMLHPDRAHGAAHAEHGYRFGIAQDADRVPLGLGKVLRGSQQWHPGQRFRGQRRRGNQNGAGNRDHAQDRVNREAQRDEDRHPGQIQECCEPAVPDEVADGRDVAECPGGIGPRIGDAGAEHPVEGLLREGPIDADAHAIEDGGAQAVEAGIDRQHEHRDERHHQQRGQISARQHAVVHLDRIERHGKQGHIGESAERHGRDQSGTQLAARRHDRGLLLGLGGAEHGRISLWAPAGSSIPQMRVPDPLI